MDADQFPQEAGSVGRIHDGNLADGYILVVVTEMVSTDTPVEVLQDLERYRRIDQPNVRSLRVLAV